MLALATEALFQVLLGDVARVTNVKVMEGKSQILLSDGLSTVNGNGEEFRVINLTIVIKINSFEDLIDLFLTHIQLVESLADLAELQGARVVHIECAEGVSQDFEVELGRIGLIDEEGKSLNLKALVCTEVLDAAKHLELLSVEKGWVVARVVGLDVIGGEPWVLKALLGGDPLGWVLGQHLGDQVLG